MLHKLVISDNLKLSFPKIPLIFFVCFFNGLDYFEIYTHTLTQCQKSVVMF